MSAANRYTTTELLASVRRKAHIPTAQSGFGDSDILAIGDDELKTALLRQILSVRENFYLTYSDLTITSDGMYDVPARAIGGSLATIKIVNGTQILEVARSELNEQFSTVTSPTGYYTFTPIGNQFRLQPNPTTGVIRVWFYTRPNLMVATSAAAQITSIASNVVTCSSIPTTFTTATPLDIIQDQPFFTGRLFDSTPTNVTSTTITFSSDVPSTVVAGDWVALAGQTPVPQIPVEFSPLLVQRAVVKYYEIQGYLDKMKAAQEKLKEMEKDVFELINPRVKEEPKRIVPNSEIIGGFRRWRSWRAT